MYNLPMRCFKNNLSVFFHELFMIKSWQINVYMIKRKIIRKITRDLCNQDCGDLWDQITEIYDIRLSKSNYCLPTNNKQTKRRCKQKSALVNTVHENLSSSIPLFCQTPEFNWRQAGFFFKFIFVWGRTSVLTFVLQKKII